MPQLERDSPSTMTHWFQDEAWKRLRHAETREPHPPKEMTSANSKGPIKMWLCDEQACLAHAFTYSNPHDPPVCYGGAVWSFRTSFYDPRLHRSEGAL